MTIQSLYWSMRAKMKCQRPTRPQESSRLASQQPLLHQDSQRFIRVNDEYSSQCYLPKCARRSTDDILEGSREGNLLNDFIH